MREASKIPP
ncbi:hypothetical protein YPPY03_1886, partial [Yersinia pestis PY-03]